jgi:hypothetical protein
VGDHALDFKPFGGYEVLNEEDSLYSNCINRIPFINEMLHPQKQTFFAKQVDRFGFNGTKEYLIPLKVKLIPAI